MSNDYKKGGYRGFGPNPEVLTDKEEIYCQQRAMGMTKTKAAKIAYDGSAEFANRIGWEVEQKDKVKQRIQELKDERAEVLGLDIHEQMRKLNDIYMQAMEQGKLALAMQAQDRINQLAGFDIKRSISVSEKTNKDSIKDQSGDVTKDVKKFAQLLGVNEEEPTKH